MMAKEEEALNQLLDKQLKTELIMESSSRYTVPCFSYSKEGWISMVSTRLQKVEPAYDKG